MAAARAVLARDVADATVAAANARSMPALTIDPALGESLIRSSSGLRARSGAGSNSRESDADSLQGCLREMCF
jgi:hypothetical protein